MYDMSKSLHLNGVLHTLVVLREDCGGSIGQHRVCNVNWEHDHMTRYQQFLVAEDIKREYACAKYAKQEFSPH